jgi:hypothetical protein
MLNIVNGKPMPCRVTGVGGESYTGYVRINREEDKAYIYSTYRVKPGTSGLPDPERFMGGTLKAMVPQPSGIEFLGE